MVVDDAIVVAENISRLRSQKFNAQDAAVKGTTQVFFPILASILTTCIAFIPLYFFKGHFGQLNKVMPPIIFMMLGASLLESLIILPGHMYFEIPKIKQSLKGNNKKNKLEQGHWFHKVEGQYGKFLQKILPYKYIVLLLFIVLLIASYLLVKNTMKFVMFPNEETRDIVISGSGRAGF